MRIITIISICFLLVTNIAKGQKAIDTVFRLPEMKLRVTDFQVDEFGMAYVPLNGGVYMPQFGTWFIPSDNLGVISSVVVSQKDSSFYIAETRRDSTFIRKIKPGIDGKPMIEQIDKVEKALYNLRVKDNVLLLWGVVQKKSKIGIYTSSGIKWLVQLSSVITDVAINDEHEIFFSCDSAIFNLSKMKPRLRLKEKIYGFSFDSKNNLFVSTNTGISRQDGSVMNVIASGYSGPLEVCKNNLYVLSYQAGVLWQVGYTVP